MHHTNPPPEHTTADASSTPSGKLLYAPNVDICDAGPEVTLVADVPGSQPDTIDIRYEDGVLTLHAPVAPREVPGRMLKQEYGIGSYRRSFRLGEGFDPSQITAEAKHGVVTIHVPRLAATQPRKIAVTSA
ncbi:MAG: Hsp20/alpha crystallin family protein [Pirellulales bacterium]